MFLITIKMLDVPATVAGCEHMQRRIINTSQGGATEGNKADGALLVIREDEPRFPRIYPKTQSCGYRYSGPNPNYNSLGKNGTIDPPAAVSRSLTI